MSRRLVYSEFVRGPFDRLRAGPLGALRPGFTLMELMVSVAILLAVLAMVGAIFSTTSKAGGQATALTTVYRQLGSAAEVIRQDLANIQPGSDKEPNVLGIAGAVVNARDDRNNDALASPHRADVLMFLTRRGDMRPYHYEDALNRSPDDYLGAAMQVVYSHADVDQYNAATGTFTGTVKRIEDPLLSPIPSYDWHLGRRTLFFPSTVLAPRDPAMVVPLASVSAGATQDRVLYGVADVWPLSVPALPAGVFGYSAPNPGLPPSGYLGTVTGGYTYTAATPGLYFNGTHWFQYNGSNWAWSDVPNSLPLTAVPAFPFDVTLFQTLAAAWLYNDGAVVNRRTVIDPSPPAGQAWLAGPHFLPNCCDFRVEYTYDDPREVGSANLDMDPLAPGIPNSFTRPIRWQSVAPGTRMIWSNTSTQPKSISPVGPAVDERTFPFRWPRALRITLRAYDAGGRLKEPVTHTIIHAWP